MRIGELADRAGVTVRMVRHYTDVGLLEAARGNNGYRDYDVSQVGRARQIKMLMDFGLTTAQVAGMAGCLEGASSVPACPAAQDLVGQHIASLDTQIARLSKLRESLRAALRPTA